MSISTRLMEVRYSVVRVVLIFPPSHAEALHQVSPENARQVSVGAVLEHLSTHTRRTRNAERVKWVGRGEETFFSRTAVPRMSGVARVVLLMRFDYFGN